MPVKNPHAAQVSKVLGAKANGWAVTRESGQRIDYNLNQSLGARFPVSLVTWGHDERADVADEIVEKLKAAGYHAEIIDVPTGTANRVMRRAVAVRSQEDLDDQAARKERSANADAEAEKLVPATARIRLRVTTYPDHARRTYPLPRAEAVALAAEALRLPATDVLDSDGIDRECLADSDLFEHRERMAGLHTTGGGKRSTVLFIPVDDSGRAAEEPVAPAPAEPARPAVEGTVLPAGHTLGAAAEHADDDNVRDAVAALTAAGHAPALLANETDDDDVDTARGTGFLVDVRGSRVLVGHLVDGVDAWKSLPDKERRAILRTYRATLRAAGWETEARIIGSRLYAWRTSPLPEGVTLSQTRGETPSAPVSDPLGATKNRKLADPEPTEEDGPRFVVKKVSSTTYGVWDTSTEVWVRTGSGESCEEGADGLNEGRLELDTLGRIKDPQRPDDGPYEVYMRPDVGYAADARRATLAEAQQVAEDGASARGLDPKGLGYVWELGVRIPRSNFAEWELRAVYEWAKRTGITIEGPLPGGEFDAARLPRLSGHEVTVERPDRPGGKHVVALRERGAETPLYTFETWNPPAIPSVAKDMVRVRRGVLQEEAALAALDNNTTYAMYETDAEPVKAATAEQVRERLRRARAEAGPEKLNGHNTPRMTLQHSGTSWITTIHTYSHDGRRSLRNQRSIAVRPAVVDRAAKVIMDATGDGVIWPVNQPGSQTFGPWVRSVPGRPDAVIVSRVACGLHHRPEHEPAASNWDEWMTAYRQGLEAAGWTLDNETADGWIFQEPSDQ
ncbi:hypothetical protein ABZS76_32815 [Streptomyces sp. NPDC005562]|uniref:hypothetical protein n=1 Tax=Streptomyces sp. NPDC005562 TaxID=3154890 RepID=UPI0033A80C86